MGQRHQIYLCLTTGTNRHGKDNKSALVGIHHQWHYGSLPIRSLSQFLAFAQKTLTSELGGTFAEVYDGGRDARRALAALYSLNMATGEYASADELNEDWGKTAVEDPRFMANNDGITIIDLTTRDAPKFAFFFFDGGDPGVAKAKQMRPMSASQYLGLYYDRDARDENRRAPALAWELADKLDAQFKLLSRAEIKQMFPKMFVAKKA